MNEYLIFSLESSLITTDDVEIDPMESNEVLDNIGDSSNDRLDYMVMCHGKVYRVINEYVETVFVKVRQTKKRVIESRPMTQCYDIHDLSISNFLSSEINFDVHPLAGLFLDIPTVICNSTYKHTIWLAKTIALACGNAKKWNFVDSKFIKGDKRVSSNAHIIDYACMRIVEYITQERTSYRPKDLTAIIPIIANDFRVLYDVNDLLSTQLQIQNFADAVSNEMKVLAQSYI